MADCAAGFYWRSSGNLPIPAQAGHVERGSVEHIGGAAGGLFQAIQKLIDVFEFRVARQQAFLFQRVRHFLDNLAGRRRRYPRARP